MHMVHIQCRCAPAFMSRRWDAFPFVWSWWWKHSWDYLFNLAVHFWSNLVVTPAYLWLHISIYDSVGGWRTPCIASCVTIYRLIGMLECWTLEMAIFGLSFKSKSFRQCCNTEIWLGETSIQMPDFSAMVKSDVRCSFVHLVVRRLHFRFFFLAKKLQIKCPELMEHIVPYVHMWLVMGRYRCMQACTLHSEYSPSLLK